MKTNNVSNKWTLLVNSLTAVPACQIHDSDTDWFPAVDVTETGHEYVAEVDLPGLNAEDIQLSVDSQALSIRGQQLQRPRVGSRLRIERPSGEFFRELPLPPDAHGEIRATLCNGVLELHVPRTLPGSEPEQTRTLAPEQERCAMTSHLHLRDCHEHENES